jgi:hypothetical protein
LAGGSGGRVSINVFSRHDETQIFVHGNLIYVFFCFCNLTCGADNGLFFGDFKVAK